MGGGPIVKCDMDEGLFKMEHEAIKAYYIIKNDSMYMQ